ncbi:MAG TPA: PorV/PorQ family protein [Ignavibacteriales bacterium]|nr:PorV/PorQ family protein [Ignavibacteriales bacterium]
MKTLNRKIKISLLLLSISCVSAFGQSKTGTTIGQFLKIEPSARGAAMGNAFTSQAGEASAAFFNPASLGRMLESDVQFTHNEWLADINYNYAALALSLENIGTLALNVISLNSGEIDVRTVEQPLGTGERYEVTNFALGLGYGVMLTDRVSAGIVVNYIQETIWHSSLNNFAVNLGVQYELAGTGIILGASVSNFGPRAKYDGRDLYIDVDLDPDKHGDNDLLPSELRMDEYSLPTVFRVGISAPFKLGNSHKFTIAADAIHPNDNMEKVNVGAEWEFKEMFSLRGGYRDLFLPQSEGGLTLGAGIRMSMIETYNVRFDYAWSDYGRLNDVHRMSIGFSF